MYIKWNWLPPDCCGHCNAIFLLKLMGPKFTTLFIYSASWELVHEVHSILIHARLCFVLLSWNLLKEPLVTIPYLGMTPPAPKKKKKKRKQWTFFKWDKNPNPGSRKTYWGPSLIAASNFEREWHDSNRQSWSAYCCITFFFSFLFFFNIMQWQKLPWTK